jgi:hypothetical protein
MRDLQAHCSECPNTVANIGPTILMFAEPSWRDAPPDPV